MKVSCRQIGRFAALAGCALFAGCGPEGTLQLAWGFSDEPAKPIADAASCGAHGVTSFAVEARSDEGVTSRFEVLCAQGQAERSLPPGAWTVTLIGLDIRGEGHEVTMSSMPLRGAAGPVTVTEDGEPVPLRVEVEAQARCADRVDNDRDGAVDGDDPDCLTGAGE